MLIDADQFNERLTSYARSAWRFETQPTYTMPNEQPTLARFLAGDAMPEGHNHEWHELVATLVNSGRSVGRVRTVQRPLTDYQRYQLAWGIPGNVNAGEDIRILDLSEHELDLPAQDFWLFDDSTVVLLNFYDDGTLDNVELLDNPDVVYYRKVRDTALVYAVSFNEWNAGS